MSRLLHLYVYLKKAYLFHQSYPNPGIFSNLMLLMTDCVDNRCTGVTKRCAEKINFFGDLYRCWLEFENCRYVCFTQHSVNRHLLSIYWRRASDGNVTRFVWYSCTSWPQRCYASAVLAMALCPPVCPSVRLSVCLSVTSRSPTKTAKRRITQTTPHDRPWILVFGCQRSPRNSTGITPCGGAKCRWGGSKSATFDK